MVRGGSVKEVVLSTFKREEDLGKGKGERAFQLGRTA